MTRTTLESAKQLKDLTDRKRAESLSKSEIETNAVSDSENAPLSPDTFKKVQRIQRK